MRALALTAEWPVAHVAAATVTRGGAISTIGHTNHRFHLASISKMFVGWTALVAREEGTLDLDQPLGQDGCTVRHLLAHAGGYAFDGDPPTARPGVRRTYSNTGIEMVAAAVADAARMPYEQYQREALLEPLGMEDTELRGSPAHGVHSTLDDLIRFVTELHHPRLLSAASAAEFSSVQFPGLSGVVPGIGRFSDCQWGLATEIRGNKQPHWTGLTNSPATFGHFGGAGTLLWVDPGAHIACLALTDRPFTQWSAAALHHWPRLADACLAEAAA